MADAGHAQSQHGALAEHKKEQLRLPEQAA
jgi:hypothetical protein